MNRMIIQAHESREASRTLTESIPLLNRIQQQSEHEITSAIERVEHLIVMCDQVSNRNENDNQDQ